MKPIRLFFLVWLPVAFISGCSANDIEKVDVYKMSDFSTTMENSHVTFDEPEVVEVFDTAINQAKLEPGIVDMAEPEYKIVLGETAYFLWINPDHATIMNMKDTHRISTLSKSSAQNIYEILEAE